MLSHCLSPITNMPSALLFLAGLSSALGSPDLGIGWPHLGSVLKLSSGPCGDSSPPTPRSIVVSHSGQSGDGLSEW